MSRARGFKQKLASVMRLWGEEAYDEALAEVESLLEAWPGNAHLHILWASLVQLQDEPNHGLDEAKRALQRAIELDKSSPAGPIELGHFLDAVEDKPQAALKAYAEGVTAARRLLIEGLIGQAKVLRELNKQEEFFNCLSELLHLIHFDPGSKGGKSGGISPDVILESPTGRVYDVQLKGPYAEQIGEILDGVRSNRSA
jgi:tetratricopeptide (TPR) repeat protein